MSKYALSKVAILAVALLVAVVALIFALRADASPVAGQPCVPASGPIPEGHVLHIGCGRPVVFFLHPLGVMPADMPTVLPHTWTLLNTLANDYGFGVVVGDLAGPSSWESPAALAALEDLVGQYAGADPPQFIAMSMGGSLLLRYSENHVVGPSVGLLPVTAWDTQPIRDLAGPRDTLPRFVNFHYQVWSGSEDTIVNPPYALAHVDYLGSVQVRTITGGHADLPWPAPDIAAALLQ